MAQQQPAQQQVITEADAQESRTRLQAFRMSVLPRDKMQELTEGLPQHITPALFTRNLDIALMANPELMAFHPGLIFREIIKAASLGLLLDPYLGEAYLVACWNYKTKRKEPQLRVGYKGMIKLARQSGDVTTIYAHEVCATDIVEVNLGYPKLLSIKPRNLFDRGPVMGYVAVIGFKRELDEDPFDFEPMSVAQCLAIRDRSDGWKALQEKRIKSTPWLTDQDEMSRKTVLRRLLKRQQQSRDLGLTEAIRIEDEAEFPGMQPGARQAAPPIEVNTRHQPPQQGGPPAPDDWIGPDNNHGEPPDETSDKPERGTGSSSPDKPAQAGPPAPPPDEPKPEPPKVAQWLIDFNDRLKTCEDMTVLMAVQMDIMVPKKGHVPAEEWKRAETLVTTHVQRIMAPKPSTDTTQAG